MGPTEDHFKRLPRLTCFQSVNLCMILLHDATPTLTLPLMSESSTTTSSATFRSILNAALDNYRQQTGIDLTNHSSANRFRTCNTSEDILRLFQDRETVFKDYRNKNRKLIDCLHPIVQVVHAFARVLGEVGSLVSP